MKIKDKQPMTIEYINKMETLYFNLVKRNNTFLHIYIDNKGETYKLANILRDIDNRRYDYKTRKELYEKWFSHYYSNINYEDFLTLYYTDFGFELPYMLNKDIFLTKKEMLKQNSTYDFITFEEHDTIYRIKHKTTLNKNGNIFSISKGYNKETDTFTYEFTYYISGGTYVHSEKIKLKEDITNSRELYELGMKISKEKDIANIKCTPQPYWND